MKTLIELDVIRTVCTWKIRHMDKFRGKQYETLSELEKKELNEKHLWVEKLHKVESLMEEIVEKEINNL